MINNLRITGNYCKGLIIIFVLISIIFLFERKTISSPVGKSIFCESENSNKNSYNSFRAFKFETGKSVRVVTIKEKNNNLKIVSKQTPFKTDNEKIKFKIKFIWYGDIYFEIFEIDRKTLTLNLLTNNQKETFSCDILRNDFMKFINKKKDEYQKYLNEEVFSNQI